MLRTIKNFLVGLMLILLVHYLDRYLEGKMERGTRSFVKGWAIAALIIAVLVLFKASTATPQVSEFVMGEKAHNNMRFLYTISARAGSEFAFCAYGYVSNDTLHLERLTLPRIGGFERDSVTWTPRGDPHIGCDPFYVYPLIGHGHSHLNYEPRDVPPTPQSRLLLCEVSDGDIRFMRSQDTPFHFLACMEGTKVYDRIGTLALYDSVMKAKRPP